MQIQSWEGAALSRAETVLQGTTHDSVSAEIGYGGKVSQRLWSKKVEEGIGLTARHRDAQRLGQREDHVQIAGGEKFSSTRSDPAVPSSGLTLRAMAIATVIGDGGTMSAAGALIEIRANATQSECV
jgi:hypothetical protein